MSKQLEFFILASLFSLSTSTKLPDKPNIIIIYGDDVGYGDLNMYGHPTTATPNLNRMANEGLRMLQFYSAAPVCSPSRASLMTGRLYPRTGVYTEPSEKSQTGLATFNPQSTGGMLESEITLAQALKDVGYATGMLGKWHLGIAEKYMPFNRGFNSYYGLPLTHLGCSSNIYNGTKERSPPGPCMVFKNQTIVSQPADVLNLDAAYVKNAKDFISAHKAGPFFFYFASHHTHEPQWASPAYQNTTRRGLYGDSLAELDWSVGEILNYVTELGIENQTLVIFSSDNGPALISGELGGEQGPLKCGKGTTYEGGVREPAIFWWPSVIRAGRISRAIGSTLDLFPTALALAGGQLPSDRPIDGYDLSKILTEETIDSPRKTMFYYSGKYLMAVRRGQYKVHFFTMGSHCLPTYHDEDCWTQTKLKYHDPPLLFDVNTDPKERDSLNTLLPVYQSIIQGIFNETAEHNKTMTFGPPMIGGKPDKDVFPCCSPSCSPRPTCCACSDV